MANALPEKALRQPWSHGARPPALLTDGPLADCPVRVDAARREGQLRSASDALGRARKVLEQRGRAHAGRGDLAGDQVRHRAIEPVAARGPALLADAPCRGG